MKIAFVQPKYSRIGGSERYLYNLTKDLLTYGMDIHIFASRFEESPPLGITCHTVETINATRTAFLLSFLRNSASMIEDMKFDIIQSAGKTIPADIYRLGGGLHDDFLQHKPAASKFDRLSPFHIAVRRIEKKIFREKKFSKIIAISSRVKSLLMVKYEVPGCDIKKIYNPLMITALNNEKKEEARMSFRRYNRIPEDRLCFLFIAENFKLKGLKELIEAFSHLPEEKRKKSFVIIAGGGRANYYEKLLRNMGCRDSFLFAGRIKYGIEDIYAAADVLVHPTYYDPFSNVCLEAMASGLPVITTKINGFSEIIESGNEGFIVNSARDTGEISSAMSLLFNKDKKAELSCAAAQRAKEFTMEKHIKSLIPIYEDTVRKKDKLKRVKVKRRHTL